MRSVRFGSGFEDWQAKAREALSHGFRPDEVLWEEGSDAQGALIWLEESPSQPSGNREFRVPKSFPATARLVASHSDPQKWSLLYCVLWRLTHGEPHLLEDPTDADCIALRNFEQAVRKDAYRMVAFVRFREVRLEDGSWFVAWYEPEHDTVAQNADFFVERFANMRWSILTPRRCMHWDGKEVSFTEGVDRSAAPDRDELEGLWLSYYGAIFNPSRLKIKAMQAQLLKRNWKNLPEVALIETLIRNAPRRTENMLEASEFKLEQEADYRSIRLPEKRDYLTLREAASVCRSCPLWKTATCTVFGEGLVTARVVFVGEQPGDQEDRVGKPFVGPAGQVLDRALALAGISRSGVYITNAVKHFKFEPRGKRRIHKTVGAREIAACRPWLQAELELIQPELTVALGATAARSLFNSEVRVRGERGRVLDSPFGRVLVTIHPSALLRLPQGADPDAEFNRFVNDLRQIPALVRGEAASPIQ